MFDIYEPKLWVSLAFILFIALSGKKIITLLFDALDKRTDKIKSELDEAKRLHVEAEEVLTLYKNKQLEFSKEAENIIAKARDDADANSARAQAELKIALDARLKHALEKIEQEEAIAIADVRKKIVNMTLVAAHNIIAEQVTSTSDDALVKMAISDIEHKIH
jgi:F-type H+-transporting ATPase subunit b